MDIAIYLGVSFAVLGFLGAYFYWEAGEFWFAYAFFFVIFLAARHLGAFDPEVRLIRDAEQAAREKPELRTQDIGNGCTLNFWYGSGVVNGVTTKFVRCKDSTTKTFESYQCGSSKAPRTCERELEVIK